MRRRKSQIEQPADNLRRAIFNIQTDGGPDDTVSLAQAVDDPSFPLAPGVQSLNAVGGNWSQNIWTGTGLGSGTVKGAVFLNGRWWTTSKPTKSTRVAVTIGSVVYVLDTEGNTLWTWDIAGTDYTRSFTMRHCKFHPSGDLFVEWGSIDPTIVIPPLSFLLPDPENGYVQLSSAGTLVRSAVFGPCQSDAFYTHQGGVEIDSVGEVYFAHHTLTDGTWLTRIDGSTGAITMKYSQATVSNGQRLVGGLLGNIQISTTDKLWYKPMADDGTFATGSAFPSRPLNRLAKDGTLEYDSSMDNSLGSYQNLQWFALSDFLDDIYSVHRLPWTQTGGSTAWQMVRLSGVSGTQLTVTGYKSTNDIFQDVIGPLYIPGETSEFPMMIAQHGGTVACVGDQFVARTKFSTFPNDLLYWNLMIFNAGESKESTLTSHNAVTWQQRFENWPPLLLPQPTGPLLEFQRGGPEDGAIYVLRNGSGVERLQKIGAVGSGSWTALEIPGWAVGLAVEPGS